MVENLMVSSSAIVLDLAAKSEQNIGFTFISWLFITPSKGTNSPTLETHKVASPLFYNLAFKSIGG